MHSLPAIEGAAPPRLVRAVCLQMLALAGAAVIAALPWPRSQAIDAARPAEPKKAERRIRIVQLPRPRVDRPLPQPAAARPPAPSPPSAAPRPRPRPCGVAGRRGGPADHPQPRPARDRPIRPACPLRRRLRRGDGPPRGGERIRADLLRGARGGPAMRMTVSPGRCRMNPLVPSFVAAGIAFGAAGAQGIETVAVLELRSRVHPIVAAELSDRVREAVRRALPQARVVDSEESADFVIAGRISRGGLGYRASLELRDRSGDIVQRASATA